jgi:hypothetical protein
MMSHAEHNDNNPQQLPEDRLPYVGPHKHVCCFYRTHLDMERMWVPFMLEGLNRRQKCMVVVGTDYSVEEAGRALTTAGLDVQTHLDNGSLVIVDNEGFPTSPKVKAEEVIDFWKARLLIACNEGYQSVRVAAQMTWLADAQRERDVVPEYEFLCNKLFPELPLSALCMYDTAIFSQFQLERVTASHPYVARHDLTDLPKVIPGTEFLLRKVLQASTQQQPPDQLSAYDNATRLLAARSYVESERLYRTAVESETGLTKVSAMLGLIESLRGQGRTAEADKLEDQATELLLRR